MDWVEINPNRSHPNSITVNHGIFTMTEDELEDTSSLSTKSFTFEDKLEMVIELSTSKHEDDTMNLFMYCSPWYFSFTRGMYDLMVKDSSGQVKCRKYRAEASIETE